MFDSGSMMLLHDQIQGLSWADYHSSGAMSPSYLSGEGRLLLVPVLIRSPWTCEEGANGQTPRLL